MLIRWFSLCLFVDGSKRCQRHCWTYFINLAWNYFIQFWIGSNWGLPSDYRTGALTLHMKLHFQQLCFCAITSPKKIHMLKDNNLVWLKKTKSWSRDCSLHRSFIKKPSLSHLKAKNLTNLFGFLQQQVERLLEHWHMKKSTHSSFIEIIDSLLFRVISSSYMDRT